MDAIGFQDLITDQSFNSNMVRLDDNYMDLNEVHMICFNSNMVRLDATHRH